MDVKKFGQWLKFLSIVNEKEQNRQMLFTYFFDEFAAAPEIFYFFLEYFKNRLMETGGNEQKNLAKKYLDILESLCEKFNFFEERNALNNICFKITDEEKHDDIKELLSKYEKKSKKIMDSVTARLNETLLKENLEYELTGRYKNIYSIYKKMLRRPGYMLKLNDIFAFRIILKSSSAADCFKVLNTLHNNFQPLPDLYKDYVNIPKINGYQSLHTGLLKIVEGLDLPIEIQIRTREMNEFAENGLAAHWIYNHYKKTKFITEKEQKILNYLYCVGHASDKNKGVHCFSYMGDMIKMPKNSTVLDFAYQIHTDLGNKTASAIVNGLPKPLYYRLKEGDIIEIIQTSDEQCYQIEKKWLKYAHTKYAVKKISEYLTADEKKLHHRPGN